MTPGPGIVAYGAYVPYWRLDRAEPGAAWAPEAGARGERSVASYDEDTTTMGVEAARRALATAPPLTVPERLYFATAVPAYTDKSNAATIHAALGLDPAVPAFDFGGAVRSGVGVLFAALDAADRACALAVMADIRTGLPGGSDEMTGGDGAAAFLTGRGSPVIAEMLGRASSSRELLDRWRTPGQLATHAWEERFGEQVYGPCARAALTDALKAADLTADDVDRLVIVGAQARSARRIAAGLGLPPAALRSGGVTAALGNAGTAQAGLALAEALDEAVSGEVIVLLGLADGADAIVWRATDALADVTADHRRASGLARCAISAPVRYPTFLSWRGALTREPPRRPDPDRPAPPVALRREQWKFGFVASRCVACGTRHLPPQQICLRCQASDQMVPDRLAETCGTIRTFTIDRLSYTPSPPLVAAVVDFDGGGRFTCELTDVDASTLRPGDRVEMTFRRLYSAGHIHNYFWKARPLREGRE